MIEITKGIFSKGSQSVSLL